LYDTDKTRISLGVLIEVTEALRQYHDSLVLAGGWAPYFITERYFDHCGSLDIDLVLRPQIFIRYDSIRDLITATGFTPTSSPFKFKRNVTRDLTVELDFLSEPDALREIPERFVQVQQDLNATIIQGSSVVFQSNFEAVVTGQLLDGSKVSTKVRVADIVSMLGMKGHALGRPMKLEKDCYDLYAICGFTHGNPIKSAQEFARKSRRQRGRKERAFVQRALNRVREYFRSETSRGPVAVSRFYGMDESRRVDSYQRVSAFLKRVQSY
jgi:hypothetical protein